ncbi:MAG: NYN domain-containing protein [Gemmatimonadaceae bacterium]|nr:NYN domain-containing protein [Gemmatimonadaceae bacterium]
MNSRPPRPGAPKAPVTPMHRGPQAAFAPGNVALHAPNAALLIDFDNVTMGIQKDLHAELRNLLSSDIIKGKVAVQRAYADWRRYPQYIVPLAESSIDMIMAPAYGSSKKNATDIRLAIDALELVFTRPEIGTYILLSGDSDFSSLVIKLKEYGKYVIGVGIRESSSDLLVMNCDEYYSWNSLTGLVRSDDEDASRNQDPWQLVSEAVQRMKRNGDVMRSDRLKQVMHDIDPNFDEKDLGFSKFSRFCQEAQVKGLLSVTKLENGQLEIDAPSRAPSAPAPSAPAAAEPVLTRDDRSEDRPRRGRRGGRGRGRERDGRDEAPRAEGSELAQPAQLELDAAPAPVAERAPAPPAAATRPAARHEPRGPRADAEPAIGISGERLTRDEAFDLVKRAVEALATGDAAVRASAVRARARELLGRDSESLSERNFSRILRDAHDADRVDLRRRGDDFEVGRAAEAAPVAEQLAKAERAATPVAPAASAPAPRAGMGHRGAPARGGRGRPAIPLPKELLSVGIVPVAGGGMVSRPTAAPAAEPAESTPAGGQPAAGRRGKTTAKKAPSKRASKSAPARKAAGKSATKAAAKQPAAKAPSRTASKAGARKATPKRGGGAAKKAAGGDG